MKELDELLLGDMFGISDAEILAEMAADKKQKIAATAHKTKSRRQTRTAKSETVLAEILPPVIEQGDAWHVLSSGDVDALSYLAHLLKTTPMDYVMFSSWCMAMPDVERIAAWLESGRIKKLDAYVGEIFPNQYAAEHEKLTATMRKYGGRIAVFKNHSKIFACRAGRKAWVIESSANINTNPRTENTVITADLGLFQHHKTYFDGIRSFNRDFDDWTPQK